MKKELLLAVTLAAPAFFACSKNDDGSMPAGCLHALEYETLDVDKPAFCTAVETSVEEILFRPICSALLRGEWVENCPDKPKPKKCPTEISKIKVITYSYLTDCL